MRRGRLPIGDAPMTNAERSLKRARRLRAAATAAEKAVADLEAIRAFCQDRQYWDVCDQIGEVRKALKAALDQAPNDEPA